MNTSSRDNLNNLWVYMVIAVTGVEYFYRSPFFVVIFFCICTCYSIWGNFKVNLQPLSIIVGFVILELLQAIVFGNFVAISILNIILRLLLAYIVVQLCGTRFIKSYIHVMYIISVIALIIWIIVAFSPEIEQTLISKVANVYFTPLFDQADILYKASPTILVFNLHPIAREIIYRNSGPFWEPGAFAVFLNLSLSLNLVRERSLVARKNLFFIVAILSTFSTAGFLTLFITIIGFVLTNSLKPSRYVFVILIIGVGSYMYESIDFLSNKVIDNVLTASETSSSRFGSAVRDLTDLMNSPLIGYGRRAENRFGNLATNAALNLREDLDSEIHRNNGLTFLFVTYGLPGAALYLFILFMFFKRFCQLANYPRLYAWFAFAALLCSGFSQGIFDRVLLFALLFMEERLRAENKSIKKFNQVEQLKNRF